MTKDEVLKLAFDALMYASYEDVEYDEACAAKVLAARASIREVLAQEQEPVAWIHNFIEGGISLGKRPAGLARHPDRWTALYKDPKPCPTCEALARTVMLDQTSHDTTPPQREWVGLTDEEVDQFHNWKDCTWSTNELVRYVEFKLREKNA